MSAGKVDMNRKDFMKQLEKLLQNISPAEREEALQYYNDYFDDAGPENEREVIEALGNPAKVAETIKKDLCTNGYGDNINQRSTAKDKAVVPYGQEGQPRENFNTAQSPVKEKKMSTGMTVLIVVLCIFASPIILGVASGVFGVLTGAIVTWFSLILAFGVVAIALLAAMIVLLIVGCFCIATDGLVAVTVIGIGMLLGGIGLLFLMLTVAMAGIATPAIWRGIASLFHKKQA